MKEIKSHACRAMVGTAPCLVHMPAHAQAPTAPRPEYFVAEFAATDPEGIKPNIARVESTFRPISGLYIVHAGELDVQEGFGAEKRLVMIKFDSLAQAEAWYNSRAYQAIIPIGHWSGNTRAYTVEDREQ